MHHIPVQVLPAIDDKTRLALCDIFDNDPNKAGDRPGRLRAHNINPALELVRSSIDQVMGKDTWCVKGGLFFETEVGYRVHADTGTDGADAVWQTFLFPLRMTSTPWARPENNRLVVFNQTWDGPAAFFLKGSPDNPKEYNTVVKDYEKVGELVPGYIDPNVEMLCPHLNTSNYEGLTVDASLQWTPGVPITFPRNRLHLSTAFHKFGIKKKLGLSFFLGPR